MSADLINALSQAGVGIAAIAAVLAEIALMVFLVRVMSRIGILLVQAIQHQTNSNDRQNSTLETLRDDLNKNTIAITEMEMQLARLPAQVQAEITPSLYQLLTAIEKITQQGSNGHAAPH